VRDSLSLSRSSRAAGKRCGPSCRLSNSTRNFRARCTGRLRDRAGNHIRGAAVLGTRSLRSCAYTVRSADHLLDSQSPWKHSCRPRYRHREHDRCGWCRCHWGWRRSRAHSRDPWANDNLRVPRRRCSPLHFALASAAFVVPRGCGLSLTAALRQATPRVVPNSVVGAVISHSHRILPSFTSPQFPPAAPDRAPVIRGFRSRVHRKRQRVHPCRHCQPPVSS
jgi:hypothetical protein